MAQSRESHTRFSRYSLFIGYLEGLLSSTTVTGLVSLKPSFSNANKYYTRIKMNKTYNIDFLFSGGLLVGTVLLGIIQSDVPYALHRLRKVINLNIIMIINLIGVFRESNTYIQTKRQKDKVNTISHTQKHGGKNCHFIELTEAIASVIFF